MIVTVQNEKYDIDKLNKENDNEYEMRIYFIQNGQLYVREIDYSFKYECYNTRIRCIGKIVEVIE